MTSPLALGNPFALGATGVLTTARTDRLAMGASFRPSTTALAAVSGFLAGPANTQGELTLVSDAVLRVAPFIAVVQGTRNSVQGQYEVINSAQRDMTVPAKDATQSRRALIVVRAGDSLEAGVASSATTDGSWLEILPGVLASTNPTLPPLPADSFAGGELLIPSTGSGQPVSLTRYNPRTTTRGGILPVDPSTSAVPGNAGAPGVMVGEHRDHPTRGLERWNGTAWGPAAVMPRCTVIRTTAYPAPGTAQNVLPWQGQTFRSTAGMWSAGAPGRVTVPEAGEYDVRILIPWEVFTGQGGRTSGVRVSGGGIYWMQGHNQAANAWYGSEQSGSLALELAAGDYLEAIIVQNANPTLNVNNWARMTVELARR